MTRLPALVALLLLTTLSAAAADPPLTDGVSGAPVVWSDWLSRNAPVALLVWASWSPGAEQTLSGHEKLERACGAAGLTLMVLDVQETLEDGRKALAARDVAWIHDRHGALLKEYRIIEVPSLVLVGDDGSVLGRIEPTADAVRAWAAQ